MSRLLTGKSTIIYGAGGSIGGAVARTFAREGASVFLAGRTRASVSDRAGVITSGVVNATCGLVAG
jgi:NAD(P)-dependent dehydrogenase (short-subunit alcohol dehydrogenase family)